MSTTPHTTTQNVIKLPRINDSARQRVNTELSFAEDGGGRVSKTNSVNAFAGRPRVTIKASHRKDTEFSPMVNGNGMPAKGQERNHMAAYSEYNRFMNKPKNMTKPSVVAFDGTDMRKHDQRRRKTPGFLPSVKVKKTSGKNTENHEISTTGKIHLSPTGYSDMKVRAMSARLGYIPSHTGRMSPLSTRTAQTAPEGIVYPNIVNETIDYDDLSMLPPPKRIMPRKEVPWVFRYKVKRNMNDLAKIMASKTPPTVQPEVAEAIKT